MWAVQLREPSPSLQPRLQGTALLVLTVLVGLLGMHGLGAASPRPSEHIHAAEHTGTPASDQAAMTGAVQQCVCPDESGGTDRHGGHLDQMCASGAVAGPTVIPALAATASSTTDAPARLSATMPSEPAGGRAPPTLAQLQLLRI
jgi:hypothetical protein